MASGEGTLEEGDRDFCKLEVFYILEVFEAYAGFEFLVSLEVLA